MAEVDKYYEAQRILDAQPNRSEHAMLFNSLARPCPQCGEQTTVRVFVAVGQWTCSECYAKTK